MSEKRVLILSQPQNISRKLRYDIFANRIYNFFLSNGIESKLLNTKAYLKEIEDFKPTRIITTWPWCVSDSIIGENQIEFFATDSNMKSAEIKPLVDNMHKISAIYVFSLNLYNKLIKYGFDKNILNFSELLPTEQSLNSNYDSKIYKKELGLNKDKIYFMIFGGGEGHSVAKLSFDLNYYLDSNGLYNCSILAFVGNNQEEYERFKPFIETLKHIEGIYPLLEYDKFKKYLRAADFIIAKPGGGITSEIIALGKPGLYYSSNSGNKVIGSNTEEENAKMIYNTVRVANTHLLNPQGHFQYFIPHIKWFLENTAHAKGLAYKYKNYNAEIWKMLLEDKKSKKEINEIIKQIKQLGLNKTKFNRNLSRAQNEYNSLIDMVIRNGNGNILNHKLNYEILKFLSENLDDDSFEIILKLKPSLFYYFVDFFRHVLASSNTSLSILNFFAPVKEELDQKRAKEERRKEENNKKIRSEKELFIELYDNQIINRIMMATSPNNIYDLANRKREEGNKVYRAVMQIINPDSSNGYKQAEYQIITRFKTNLTQKYLEMVSHFDGKGTNWTSAKNEVFDEFKEFYRRNKR